MHGGGVARDWYSRGYVAMYAGFIQIRRLVVIATGLFY